MLEVLAETEIASDKVEEQAKIKLINIFEREKHSTTGKIIGYQKDMSKIEV